MPRGVKSYSNLSTAQIEQMMDQLAAEKVKREMVSPSNKDIAALGDKVSKISTELGVEAVDILNAVVESVVGDRFFVGKKRGPRTGGAVRKKTGARKKKSA